MENEKKLFKKLYSWKEISKHNTIENGIWISIDGLVYDITKFIKHHPGGEQVLILAAGRDVTNLFESYHPMTDLPSKMLKQYEIGQVSTMEFPKYVEKSKFYSTLKERVREHFKKSNKDPKFAFGIIARLIFVYWFLITSYYVSHYAFIENFYLNCLLAIVYSLSNSLFSLHMMHDACHSAISHNPKVWKWLGATYDLFIGASFFYWCNQHVIGHHVYTNIRNADPDIGDSEVDFRIVTPYQNKYWIYKYQHIYAPFLYGLYSIKYRLCDYSVFTEGSIGRVRTANASNFEIISFIIGKLVFIVFRFIIPLQYHSLVNLLTYFFIAEFFFGLYLSFGFQVSHSADNLKIVATSVNENDEPTNVDEDWAIHQIKTTQDYGINSYMCLFFSGGVNLQVVHHLFPSISQEYYGELVPIIKKVCDEYDVHYNIQPTFYAAFKSHIDFLYNMGNNENYVRKSVTDYLYENIKMINKLKWRFKTIAIVLFLVFITIISMTSFEFLQEIVEIEQTSNTLFKKEESSLIGKKKKKTKNIFLREQGIKPFKSDCKHIDIVYTWVNGSDPVNIEKYIKYVDYNDRLESITKGRYRDYGILKYSLRSVRKNAPWVRKIFIVTADQIPTWFNTSTIDDNVEFIFHSELYKNKSHLPTFNSDSIEINLFNLPKRVSNCFLYLNDDIYFSNPVLPSDFYDENFNPYIFQRQHKISSDFEIYENGTRGSIHYTSMINTNRVLDKLWFKSKRYRSDHGVLPLNKKILKLIYKKLEEEVEETSSHRFRDPKDLQFSFTANQFTRKYSTFQVKPGFNRLIPLKNVQFRQYLKLITSLKYKPKTTCLNDNFETFNNRILKRIDKTLNFLFPQISPFENGYFLNNNNTNI
ncbi:hypothetical protein ACTFIT_007840 [Dictyostelium discoideum]